MATIRRPGIEVIVEFQTLTAAFALPAMPTLIIGEAYQVVTKDVVGTYNGSLSDYPYASKFSSAVVDLALADSELLVEWPIRIFIEAGKITQVAAASTGITTLASKEFKSSSSSAFTGVVAGDIVKITAGADVGEYVIASVDPADLSHVFLQQELQATAASVNFRIDRRFSSIEIPRLTTGVVVDADSVELPASLQSGGKPIITGTVKLNYRALRPEFSGYVRTFKQFADLESNFGIGQIVPENPLAYGISLALLNTTTAIGGLGLSATFHSSVTQAYQEALDRTKEAKIGGKYIYCMVPLTQEPVVLQMFDANTELMSAPEKKKERVAIGNRKLKSITTVVDQAEATGLSSISTVRSGVGATVLSPAGTERHFYDTTTANAFASVVAGDNVRITTGNLNDGDYTVISKTSNSDIVVDRDFVVEAANHNYQLFREDGLWSDGVTFFDKNADFVAATVTAGYYLEVYSATGTGTLVGRHLISNVNTPNKITLAESVTGGPYTDVTYEINRDFTVDEETAYLAAFATSFANRRFILIWPDIVTTPVGNTNRDLPGFFACCGIGGMVSGLPAHQGFTNLTLTGYVGLKHSGDRYDQDQLDVIASGGVMILDQEVEEAPLYIRHQLTTDTSAIAYQEFSITKNLDSIARLIRETYQPYLGIYNITDTLIDLLKTIGNGLIENLKKAKLPRIGAPLRRGTIDSMVESSTAPDTVETQWSLGIPYPFNNLIVTLIV